MPKYDANGNQLGKGKGKTYGKEATARVQARKERISKGGGEPFKFSEVPPRLLLDLITVLAALGGALRVGATRDGGAMALGYYLDGDTWTEYVRPQEDCVAYLEAAIADFLEECLARGVEV